MPFTVKINSFRQTARLRLRTRLPPATGDLPPNAAEGIIAP
jgi:hypothetical protein